MTLAQNLIAAKQQMESAGWTKILTAMTSGSGLDYGTLYTKDGMRYYINKDTITPGCDVAKVAELCADTLFAK
jgi:hypothetical protein